MKKEDKSTNCAEPKVAAEEAAQAASAENAAENGGANAEAQAEEQPEAAPAKETAPSPEEQIAALNDKYLRLVAEFDNFRRRTAKERLDLITSAGENILKGLLPVLDDCERAMQALEKSSDSEAAKAGTEMIYNGLLKYLKTCGLAEIEAVGSDFDTDFHEAIAQIPAGDEKKGKVVDVVQKGYTLSGKVIRFAKVVIGQ